MSEREYKQMMERTKKFLASTNETTLEFPYEDMVRGFSHFSKDVQLQSYQNKVGKKIQYLGIDWTVKFVEVKDNKILVHLNK